MSPGGCRQTSSWVVAIFQKVPWEACLRLSYLRVVVASASPLKRVGTASQEAPGVGGTCRAWWGMMGQQAFLSLSPGVLSLSASRLALQVPLPLLCCTGEHLLRLELRAGTPRGRLSLVLTTEQPCFLFWLPSPLLRVRQPERAFTRCLLIQNPSVGPLTCDL